MDQETVTPEGLQGTSKEYFQGKIIRQSRKIDKKTRDLKKFSLTYPEILDGNKFFNEYIIYTNNIALKEFNKQNQFLVKNIIKLYEQNFNIALSIDLTTNAISTTYNSGNVKIRVYAINYNILRIMSGMGGLAYSN